MLDLLKAMEARIARRNRVLYLRKALVDLKESRRNWCSRKEDGFARADGGRGRTS